MISLVIITTWYVRYFFSPVLHFQVSRTWPEVMHLRFDRMEGLWLVSFSVMGGVSMMMFANLNEAGEVRHWAVASRSVRQAERSEAIVRTDPLIFALVVVPGNNPPNSLPNNSLPLRLL